MKIPQALKLCKSILSSVKMTQEKLVDGSIIQYDTDNLEVGEPVYLCDGATDYTVLPDGLYQTLSKVDFTIAAGKLAEVKGISQAPVVSGLPKQAMSSDDIVLDTEGNPLVKAPAAGAPANLVDPNDISADSEYSKCMMRMNEMHAQHNALQGFHNSLRAEHDDTNAKLNEVIGQHNELAKTVHALKGLLKAASDDKILMSKQIEVLSKMPAGQPIEEVKAHPVVKHEVETTEKMSFKILQGMHK